MFNYPKYPYDGQTFDTIMPKATNAKPINPKMADKLSNLIEEVIIDDEELRRALCTHKDHTTDKNTLCKNEDGSYTCSICGKTFNMFEGSGEDINNAIKTMIDMLQTCKTIYLDAPVVMTEPYGYYDPDYPVQDDK